MPSDPAQDAESRVDPVLSLRFPPRLGYFSGPLSRVPSASSFISLVLLGRLARFLPPAAAQTRWGRGAARMPCSSSRAEARRCALPAPRCGPSPRRLRHNDRASRAGASRSSTLPAAGCPLGIMISAGCGIRRPGGSCRRRGRCGRKPACLLR